MQRTIIILFVILSGVIFIDYDLSKKKQLQLNRAYVGQFSENILKNPVIENISIDYIDPEIIQNISKDTYLFDFGKVYFGTLELALKTSKKNRFFVKLYERHEEEINFLNVNSIGYFEKEYHNLSDVFRINLPARSLPLKESLPSGIEGIIPFRYAIIKTNIPLTEFSVRQVAITYPFSKNNTEFTSSNPLLSDVFSISKHTIIATSFSGLYVDGNRERKPYEADAYLNQLSHYSLDTDISMARNTQMYLLDNPTWPLEWSFFSIFMAKADYFRTKEKEYLVSIYEKLLKRLFIEHTDEKGLLKIVNSNGDYNLVVNNRIVKPIIDWPPVERKDFTKELNPVVNTYSIAIEIFLRAIRGRIYTIYGFDDLATYQKNKIVRLSESRYRVASNNFVVNAYRCQALKDMAFLSKEIGFIKNARIFTEKAKELQNTLNDLFYNKKQKLYKDTIQCSHCSFHSNLFALYFDIVPMSKKDAVISYVKENKYNASVFTSFFLIDSLFKNGEVEAAVDYMTSNQLRSWGNMLKNNASMVTEAWDTSIKPNMDWNHSWGATPVYHIIRSVVGVKSFSPLDPVVTIEPNPGQLTWFRSKVKTVIGIVAVNYEKNENSISYKITIPESTKQVLLKLKPPKNCSIQNIKVTESAQVSKFFSRNSPILINGTSEVVYQTSCPI